MSINPTVDIITTQLQPRSIISSDTAEALVLHSDQLETKLTFLNRPSLSNLTPRFTISTDCNETMTISKNDQELVSIYIQTPQNVAHLDVQGTIQGSNLAILPGVVTEKGLVLQDYNVLSTEQFAGFGYKNGILNHQLPIRTAQHVFRSAVTANANVEWMRIQEDAVGRPQVGIGTTSLPLNTSLVVAGNTRIDGRLTVYGGIDFDTSEFVRLNPGTHRLSNEQLPTGVPLLNEQNKIDVSLLPQEYNFQYLKAQKNIGIGTRIPVQKFHVHGSSVFSDRVGVGTLYPRARMDIVENAGTISAMRIENKNTGNILEAKGPNGPVMTLVGTHVGVGIGTTSLSPNLALHVQGNAFVSGVFSCSNFSTYDRLQVRNIDVVDGNQLLFRTETVMIDSVPTPFVRYGVHMVAEQGIATNVISIAGGTSRVLFKQTGIEVQGDTVLTTPPLITSDMRRKHDISRIENALEKLEHIRGYTYHIGSGKRMAGVLAQEVMQTLPEAVATMSDAYLAVRYDSIIPLLIEAIHELKLRTM